MANKLLMAAMLAVNNVAVNADTITWADRMIDRYGFPIFCVLLCFGYIWYTQKTYREDFNALHTNHAQEVKALTTALTENTEVMRGIRDFLDDCYFIDKADIKNIIEEGKEK